MSPFVGFMAGGNMAKKSRDITIDVSGTTDERGKVRNRDAEAAGRGASFKKKKRKKEERVALVIEDNTYKAGKDSGKVKKKKTAVIAEEPKLKKKKKKTKDIDDVKPGKKKKRAPITIEGESKEIVLAKETKGNKKLQQKALAAIEEYSKLPPPVDEFDAVIRAKFEAQCELAARLEFQMEDRVYARDVYALNTVYNQIREMIADLRAQRDISAQVVELQTMVLDPYHRVVGETLGLIFFHVEGAIRKFVRDQDLQEEIIKKLKNSVHEGALTLQGEYALALDRIQKVLL